MRNVPLYRADSLWRRPFWVFLLVAFILAPFVVALCVLGMYGKAAWLCLGPPAMTVIFLAADMIGRARSGKDTGLGMALFKLSSFPFQRKLGRLEKQFSEPARLQTRGLMLKDVYQAPAIIRLTEDMLEMTPVIGKPVTVPLIEIAEVVESAFFNGPWQPGQTGFMLKGPVAWRVGFAIYEDPKPWRDALCTEDKSSEEPSRSANSGA